MSRALPLVLIDFMQSACIRACEKAAILHLPAKVLNSHACISNQPCPACPLQGGETRFDHLGLSVRPCQGMALLFFPSFADGVPDDRLVSVVALVLLEVAICCLLILFWGGFLVCCWPETCCAAACGSSDLRCTTTRHSDAHAVPGCRHRHLRRALHTAEEALDTKWIMQQWVARGWGSGIPRKSPHQSTPASPDSRASPVSGTQAPERPARKRGTRARGRSAQHKASGF